MQSLHLKPLTEVWLSVPEISRWRMHPFSVADCSGSRLTLHIKRYGAFTRVGRPLAMRGAVHESGTLLSWLSWAHSNSTLHSSSCFPSGCLS